MAPPRFAKAMTLATLVVASIAAVGFFAGSYNSGDGPLARTLNYDPAAMTMGTQGPSGPHGSDYVDPAMGTQGPSGPHDEYGNTTPDMMGSMYGSGSGMMGSQGHTTPDMMGSQGHTAGGSGDTDANGDGNGDMGAYGGSYGDGDTGPEDPCDGVCPTGICDSPADAHKPECAQCAACHAAGGSGDTDANGDMGAYGGSYGDGDTGPEDPCDGVCPTGICDSPADASKPECADCAACHAAGGSGDTDANGDGNGDMGAYGGPNDMTNGGIGSDAGGADADFGSGSGAGMEQQMF